MRGARWWIVVLLGGLAGLACGGARGGGARAPAPRPLAVTAMQGPYADVDAYCAARTGVAERDAPDDPVGTYCWPVDPDDDRAELMPGAALPTGPQPLAAPFASGVFVAVGLDGPTCGIVVDTAGGWYGAPLGAACGHADSRSWSHLELVELAVKDVLPGGAPELVVRLREVERHASMDNDGVETDVDSELLVLCGVGDAGRPACAEPLTVKRRWSSRRLAGVEADPAVAPGPDEVPDQGAWERAIEYAADAIVVRGGAPDRAGCHPLAWR
jgi:hypothetical protein